ncbi:class I SAM-dependent methyltransferase [Hamadaea tsunoensis]|uniref:class I SAM-dependent methyltransferase n=1 Tax=Hamadaea tsunoensis TaxID=53368 RepID=UPI0003F6A22C|nr:class I SAM-dependent methyltransferase [Hamadaea tsunoensis]
MIDGWEWDDSLFAGAAAYYLRGRLPYAPGYAATLRDALGLDGRGRYLDAGCGPGTLTLALAPMFAGAVGIDPDAGMLAEAARYDTVGVRWVRARAEDLPAGLGTFRMVTFGNSFHWTDRDRVAATVRDMLEPGGAFVLLSDYKAAPAEPTPLPPPPYARIAELVRAYLGPVRRAGQGAIASGETPGREELVLDRAGYTGYEQHVVPAGQPVSRTADDLLAWTFSRSDSAPHLFGGRVGAFERDLRRLLADGPYAEPLPPTEIRIWRRPAS